MNPEELGKEAEAEVARQLESQGFTIVGRNVRLPFKCELDVVARKGDLLVIAEVKGVHISGNAILQVNRAKLRKLHQAIGVYLIKFPEYRQLTVRFDLFLLKYRGGTWETQHLPNVVI